MNTPSREWCGAKGHFRIRAILPLVEKGWTTATMSDATDSPSAARRGKKRSSRPQTKKPGSQDPRPPLTPRQRDVLEIVRANVEEKGYPPTVREICAKIGANSPNAAAFHLKELVRKGYLEHAGGKRGRTLTIVERPEDDKDTIPFRGKIS